MTLEDRGATPEGLDPRDTQLPVSRVHGDPRGDPSALTIAA